MSIFDKRVAFKPFEYPEILKYKDAINHSYWLVSEWNFLSDIHDFNVNLDDVEKHGIKNALLAISQIEISVKKFWTKLGDRFPKSEFEQVGVTFGECHVDGTEVLTPKGWINFSDININDDVLQFHSNNTFSITKVKNKFENDYDGKVYKFHKQNIVACVTPNHRIVFYNKKGEYVEEKAKNFIINNSDNKIPESGKIINGNSVYLSFMDRLSIVLQAGKRKSRKCNGLGAEYDICIKKQRKTERLDWILDNLKNDKVINFSKRKDKREGYYIYTVRTDDKYDYKNFDWVDLYDKSSQWCQDFIQEVKNWNGYLCKNKKDYKIKFGSLNKKVIDKVQMVGIAAGYRTNICLSKKTGYRDGYVLSFTNNRERVSVSTLKSDIVDYSGKVRCITVDSGAIITRYRDKTFISGNSEVRHSDAYSHLLQVLGLNDDFSQLLQVPVIQGRVDYLTKYIKGASDNSNENYTLALALFSIFIENVSLFSQFVIIKSFNKYKNILKDIDNVVQATQKEEVIHALLGVYIIRQIQNEFPDWFNNDFYSKLYRACRKAYEAEVGIIDWIFEAGELSFLPKEVVKEFVKDRFNYSLNLIGGDKIFEVNEDLLHQLKWFEDELYAEINTDFFHKKPVTYSKKVQAIKAEDLF